MNPHLFGSPVTSDPAVLPSLPERENSPIAGDADCVVDFDAVLDEARRNYRCAECGKELERWHVASSQFCNPKCRYRFRDRRKYAEDPERERAKSRAYYWANRERVLEKAAARRGTTRTPTGDCSECGSPLVGRQRVTCGKAGCRDARFKRLRPEAYAEREQQKAERRRARRAELRAGGEGS